MIGFESRAPLAVSQVTHRIWETTAELVFHAGAGQVISVPVGTTTDFASVPALFSWLIPKLTGVPAAVLHDHAWGLAKDRRITYRTADRLLYEALGSLGENRQDEPAGKREEVGVVTRLLVWAAVRWASILTRRGGWRGSLPDVPALVAITVPGLILTAPAVVLLPPMALLWVANRVASLTVRRPDAYRRVLDRGD